MLLDRICPAVLAFLVIASPALAAEGLLSVQACPSKTLYAFALAPATRFQSLLVPNVAVHNGGTGAS